MSTDVAAPTTNPYAGADMAPIPTLGHLVVAYAVRAAHAAGTLPLFVPAPVTALIMVIVLITPFVLPDSKSIIGFLSAVGFGSAIGYTLWLSRVTPARIAAEKAYDAAHRETTLAKLDTALADLKTALAEHSEMVAEIVELKREMALGDQRYDRLSSAFEAERIRNDKLDLEMLDFARAVLRNKGRTVDEGPHD